MMKIKPLGLGVAPATLITQEKVTRLCLSSKTGTIRKVVFRMAGNGKWHEMSVDVRIESMPSLEGH